MSTSHHPTHKSKHPTKIPANELLHRNKPRPWCGSGVSVRCAGRPGHIKRAGGVGLDDRKARYARSRPDQCAAGYLQRTTVRVPLAVHRHKILAGEREIVCAKARLVEGA